MPLRLDPDDPLTGYTVDAWLVALRAVGVPGPARQWCALRLGRVGARGWRAGGLGERWVLQAFLRFVRRSQA